MKLLALDTASDACSVALEVNGEVVSRHHVEPRAHGRLLLPMVEDVLAEAGIALNALDALAFGRGPGSFTGVRMAAGATQGLAFGADLPVLPVSTLAALAQGAWRIDQIASVAVAVDARMQEVYWGVFRIDDSIAVMVNEERLCIPGEVRLPPGQWAGVGTGWSVYADVLDYTTTGRVRVVDAGRLPHALDLLPLARHGLDQGHAVAPEQALPVYLRDSVAWKTAG